MATRTLSTQAHRAAVLISLPLLVCTCIFLLSGTFTPATGLALVPAAGAALYLILILRCNLGRNRTTREPILHFTTLGYANWLTLARGAGVVALACLLPAAQSPSEAVVQGASLAASLVYLAIALADLGDGWLARKTGRETELGRILDIETDAAGLLAAALAAVAFGRIPPFYLAAGLAYYVFIAGMHRRRRLNLALVELQPRPSGRITAGFQMGFLVVVLLPFFSPLFCSIAALLFLIPLLLGFGRDWLVVSGRLAAGRDQRTRADDMADAFIDSFLSPISRLAVLAAWLYYLILSWPELVPLIWLIGVGGCCLLVAAGILGRCISLLLVLLLGWAHSPMPTSAPVLLIFCGAVIILLGGSGSWSIWAPEEDILNRRFGNEPDSGAVSA